MTKCFKEYGNKARKLQAHSLKKEFIIREAILMVKNKVSEYLIGIKDLTNIQVNGKTDLKVAMECGKTLMEISILVNGSMERLKVMVFIQLLMDRNMKVILSIFSNMEKENKCFQMATILKAILLKANPMVKVFINLTEAKLSTKAISVKVYVWEKES